MTAFQVSPVISAVGSPSFVTLTFGESRVRVSGDESSLEKFLAVVHPPAAAPASPSDAKRGFRCMMLGEKSGFFPVNVQSASPAISTRLIAEIEFDVSTKKGEPCMLHSIIPVEVSVVAVASIPDAVGAPGEPVPADDEQGPAS